MDDQPLGAATLAVPAVAGCLPVIRSVTAAMAADADLTLDDVDDVTIAVEEAALILIGHGATSLEIRVESQPRVLSVTMTGEADLKGWPPDSFEEGLAGRIIRGVVDDVLVDDGAPRLTFTKASGVR